MAARVGRRALPLEGIMFGKGFVNSLLLTALLLDGAASQSSSIPAPTAAASSIASTATPTAFFNTEPDLGPTTVLPYDWSGASFCTCDVTRGACDVNCCCDSDCDGNDRAAFSECDEQLYNSASQYCLRKDVVYTQNVEYIVNTSSSYLFCIQTDNYAARNFYSLPATVNNASAFSEYEQRYGSYNFSGAWQSSQSAAASSLPTLQPFYQSGDPILTLFAGNLTGYFSIPRAYASGACEDFHPVGFWYDASTSCTRSLAVDLSQACNSSSYLNMHSFYAFRIARGTGDVNLTADDMAFDNSSFISVGLGGVYCYSSSGLPIACSAYSPSYNITAALCLNAVTQVNYVVTLAASSTTIQDVNVSFSLQHLSAAQFPLVQTYSIKWVQAEATSVFKRSGNPGYLRGQPVVGGQLASVAGSRYEIVLSGNRNNYLTTVTSTAGGSCQANPLQRTPIRFGINLRSGCAVSVSYQNMTSTGICNTIYTAILNALLGDTFKLDSSVYVATFGNSLTNVTGDWVPILVAQQPSSPPVSAGTGVCQSMILGMHVDFLYANIGPLANPQAKIIGAQLSFLTGQEIRYSCTGAFACAPGAASLKQTFEISSSVAFVDVSSPSVAAIAEQPIITAKIPYDFFYPFYMPSSAMPHHSPGAVLLVATAAFFLFS